MVDKKSLPFDKVESEDVFFSISLGEGKYQFSFQTNLGAFGNVRYAWLKKDPKKKYAVKSMKKAEIIASKHVDHIENEKNILALI